MRILHYHLKSQWYDMIERGEKPEEYRAATEYWTKRLTNLRHGLLFGYRYGYEKIPFKEFDQVKFYRGYTKRTMTFECKGLDYGLGKEEWGAPKEKVFITRLGKRIS